MFSGLYLYFFFGIFSLQWNGLWKQKFTKGNSEFVKNGHYMIGTLLAFLAEQKDKVDFQSSTNYRLKE